MKKYSQVNLMEIFAAGIIVMLTNIVPTKMQVVVAAKEIHLIWC